MQFVENTWFEDWRDRVINGLVVRDDLGRIAKPRNGHSYWRCECAGCGREVICQASQLRRGKHGCRSCSRFTGSGVVSGTYWGNLVRQAVGRGLSVEITIKQASELFERQEGRCFYTGLPLAPPSRHAGSIDWTRITASLDRLDSRIGYVAGNVAWVHKRINAMKNDVAHDDFLALVRMIASRHPGLSGDQVLPDLRLE